MVRFNFATSVANKLRNIDAYGHPINLTYKNDTTYKSLLGGAATILTRIGIFAFFLVELMNVINKKDSIRTSSIVRDFAIDPTVYTLNETVFDLAVNFYYNNADDPKQSEISKNMHQYMEVIVTEESFEELETNNGT